MRRIVRDENNTHDDDDHSRRCCSRHGLVFVVDVDFPIQIVSPFPLIDYHLHRLCMFSSANNRELLLEVGVVAPRSFAAVLLLIRPKELWSP